MYGHNLGCIIKSSNCLHCFNFRISIVNVTKNIEKLHKSICSILLYTNFYQIKNVWACLNSTNCKEPLSLSLYRIKIATMIPVEKRDIEEYNKCKYYPCYLFIFQHEYLAVANVSVRWWYFTMRFGDANSTIWWGFFGILLHTVRGDLILAID